MSEAAYEQLKRKTYIDYKLLEGEWRGGKPVDARESLRKMREKVVAYSKGHRIGIAPTTEE
jgi:hypothetical protein